MQEWEYCQLHIVFEDDSVFEYPVHWSVQLCTIHHIVELFRSESLVMKTTHEGNPVPGDPLQYAQMRNALISRLGAEGWEMAATNRAFNNFFFKRPKR